MDEAGAPAIEFLKTEGCEVIYPSSQRPLQKEQLIEELAGVDAVLAGTDKFSKTVLSSNGAASLKIISRWGVGFNDIDITAATEAGIIVAYTPGMLDEAVADYAFSLLLSAARGVGFFSLASGASLLTTSSFFCICDNARRAAATSVFGKHTRRPFRQLSRSVSRSS